MLLFETPMSMINMNGMTRFSYNVGQFAYRTHNLKRTPFFAFLCVLCVLSRLIFLKM